MPTTMSARNKKFWGMSREKQRIAVAYDVLKWLSTKFVKPTEGSYLVFQEVKGDWFDKNRNQLPPKLDNLFTQLQQTKGASCAVCGIGACFVGLVNVGDRVLTNSVINYQGIADYIQISSQKMRSLLREVFPPSQLTLIECAFESSTAFHDGSDRRTGRIIREDQIKAKIFGDKYIRPTNRLKAIMLNIIKNNGTFKP